MTNNEAIVELRDLIACERTDKENEALLMAIETLRNEEKLLYLCNQVQEENGQTHIHIADVRRILGG